MISNLKTNQISINSLAGSKKFKNIYLRSVYVTSETGGLINVFARHKGSDFVLGTLTSDKLNLPMKLKLDTTDDLVLFSEPKANLGINYLLDMDDHVKDKNLEVLDILPALLNTRSKYLNDKSNPESVSDYFAKRNKKVYKKSKNMNRPPIHPSN